MLHQTKLNGSIMSRNDNLFDEYSIVDDNPDLHPDDNFFMKSPPAVKFEMDDDLMEVRRNDEFDHEGMNSFPTEMNPDDIIENIVRFYSLPYGVDEAEIVSVFQHDIPELSPDDAILIKYPNGKPTGTAFLNLGSKDEVQAVLKHNGSPLGGSLLMMLPSTEKEIEKCQEDAEKNEPANATKPVNTKVQTQVRTQCVHMKGVCLTSNHNAIRRFFEPIRIPSQSVFLIPRQSGASSLEAYVQFRDTDDCASALSKQGSQLDGSDIDVYPVSRNAMLDAIEMYGVLDKGPSHQRTEYVDSDIIDARLKARQEILKERDRGRSRSPLYRSTLLSRERDEDTLSTLQEIELMRERDRHREKDRYYERERRGDIDRKELSLGYSSKRDRVGDSLRSRYYSREDEKGLDSRRYTSREDEYRISPHNKRLNRRSPYMDRLSSTTGRSRDLGYSSEFSKNPTLRLTGLPTETLIYDVIDFFHGFDLKIDSIRIQCNEYGTPNGKAFVRFPSFSQAMLAIDQCKGKGLAGSRSIDMTLI